jgi:site-specific recombinase XerD
VRTIVDTGRRLGAVLALERRQLVDGVFHFEGTAHNGVVTGDTETKKHTGARAGDGRPARADRGAAAADRHAPAVPGADRQALAERNFYRDVWEPTRRASGMDLTPHDCRHSFVTNLAAAGIDEADLCEIVGQSPETMRKHYRHPLAAASTRSGRRSGDRLQYADPSRDRTDHATRAAPHPRTKITMPGHRYRGVPNPHKGERFPVTVLKRAEVDALIEGCNCGLTGLRNRAMIADLVGTGSRVSEMLSRRVDDIDWDDARGPHPRHEDGERRPLRRHGARAVQDRARLEGRPRGRARSAARRAALLLRLEHEVGNQVKPAQVRQMMHRLAEQGRIKKRVHPHCCRHTFACWLREAGVDLEVVQLALGHSNIAVTHTYLNHVPSSRVVRVTAALSWSDAA